MVAASDPLIPGRYIGNSVYVWFDGYHIVLEQDGETRIALGPYVLRGLDGFRNDLKQRLKELEQEGIVEDNEKSS